MSREGAPLKERWLLSEEIDWKESFAPEQSSEKKALPIIGVPP